MLDLKNFFSDLEDEVRINAYPPQYIDAPSEVAFE
jgi:hypothetical protein